jgi:uncharacterized SAM-binding protein YcdF (DUF218 family)
MVSRALALVLGVWLLASALHAVANSLVDPLIWLLDLRFLPRWVRAVVCLPAGGVLVAFALGLRMRWPAAGVAGGVAAVALVDCVAYWRLRSVLADSAWWPASLVTLGAAAWVAVGALRGPGLRPTARRRLWLPIALAAVLGLGFPLVPMITFGLTDYRRPADAVLVFGARVYASGALSHAAEDRVRAAVALAHAGLVETIVFSGGPGDGGITEAAAMADQAVALGVERRRIVLDDAGLDTRASVRNTQRLAAERGWRRVLATSHFYHLPRIKIECERVGLACYTVPAPQARPLLGLPWFMTREVAAWWRALLLPWI